MSAATIASWADNGTVISDTLDTCIVEVKKDSTVINYTVDMQRGVITAMSWSGNMFAYHRYFYRHENGIYFLSRVVFGDDSTIQNSGGYEFSNIRINGAPTASIAHFQQRPAPRNPAKYYHPQPDGEALIYDLLGRRVGMIRDEINRPSRLPRALRLVNGAPLP
jgi:hypothetical protein